MEIKTIFDEVLEETISRICEEQASKIIEEKLYFKWNSHMARYQVRMEKEKDPEKKKNLKELVRFCEMERYSR